MTDNNLGDDASEMENKVNETNIESNQSEKCDGQTVDENNEKSNIEPGLYLYDEEVETRPHISQFISSLANYENTIPAATDPDAKAPAPSARMGTLIGVFLPCIQNIFGVILFIRLTWVVGTAGAICGFLIVLTCCCVVIITKQTKKRKYI